MQTKNILEITLAAMAILILGILIGQQINQITSWQSDKIILKNNADNNNFKLNNLYLEKIKPVENENKNKLSADYENAVKIKIPAVMKNNKGIMTELIVYAKPGIGNIFFNFNNVLVAPDTEQSIRVAIDVASDVANISVDNLDFYFTISNINASVLEGPSAGAAFAIATIATLQNKTINNKTIITGTLNHDGTLGIAAGISQKAIAAKNQGADMFLVPYGLSKELNFTQKKYCKEYGIFEYCQDEFNPYWIDIGKDANITIKEIKTINEAMEYFFIASKKQ